jgi:AcrR family transcriptional regulator
MRNRPQLIGRQPRANVLPSELGFQGQGIYVISTDARALRGDAERNRKKLLEVASCAFAEAGFEVSVEDIARRAGVGKGTVFRRFPTKEHLVVAIVCARLQELIEVGTPLLDAQDAGEAMRRFMRSAVETLSQDRGLLEAIHGLASTSDELAETKHATFELVTRLLSRAQQSGAVRTDVTACDVMLLVSAISYVAAPFRGVDDDLWTRYFGLVYDGLRPAAATPCLHPPPSEDQMHAAVSSHACRLGA